MNIFNSSWNNFKMGRNISVAISVPMRGRFEGVISDAYFSSGYPVIQILWNDGTKSSFLEETFNKVIEIISVDVPTLNNVKTIELDASQGLVKGDLVGYPVFTYSIPNEEEDLYSLFAKPTMGNCACNIPRKDCDYHR